MMRIGICYNWSINRRGRQKNPNLELARATMNDCPLFKWKMYNMQRHGNPELISKYMRKYCGPDKCVATELCFPEIGIPINCPMGRRSKKGRSACVECKLIGSFKCPWEAD